MILSTLAVLASASLVHAAPATKHHARSLHGIDALADKPKLTFDQSGAFKVVAFSDMHFGERNGDGSWAEWGPANDANTQRVHGAVIDKEKPNYVVLNGDLVTGENLNAQNATAYLDLVFAPTVARNVPFSSTHGNHDNANNINHQTEIEYESSHYPLSYTRSDAGPKPYGNGNYWVPVFKDGSVTNPSLILWFFDSRSFVSGTGNGPGPVPDEANFYWIDETTVPAYIKDQASLMKSQWGDVPPSLVFTHIPFQISQDLAKLPSAGAHDDEPNPSTQGSLGSTYTGKDKDTFNAILEDLEGNKGKVLAITSGHDHGESWCVAGAESSGVPVCFDGHSGYGGYVTKNTALRNGRVFSLDVNDLSKVVSWNSFEDGSKADEVTLTKSA